MFLPLIVTVLQEYELRPGEYQVVSGSAPAAPRSPFADGWPQDGSFCDLPHSPFAPDWQAHLGQRQQPQPQPFAQQAPLQQQAPFAQQQLFAQQQAAYQQQQAAWPPADPLAGAGAWQGDAPAAAAERVPAPRRRRPIRRGGARSAPAAPAAEAGSAEGQRAVAAWPARPQQAGRLVRPASKGRVGVDIGRERDTTPLLLRPIFALIPFLRYWGGFL